MTRTREDLLAQLAPHDAGNGVRWGWAEGTGDVWWVHPCRGRDELAPIDVTSGTRHALSSRDPLTIVGSVLCATCSTHGWIRDGVWEAA